MNSMTPISFANSCGSVRHLRHTRFQRGASLLEGIAYLGIAAIVILGAVSLLTGAFSSAKANQTSEEIVALRTAARKLYIGQPYPTDLLPNMIAAKAIPATLINSGTAVTNSWGGNVTLAGTTSTFTITYTAMPKDVCMSVVSGANGWNSIAGNGAAAIPTSASPATAANAATVCSLDTAAGNTVAFVAQ